MWHVVVSWGMVVMMMVMVVVLVEGVGGGGLGGVTDPGRLHALLRRYRVGLAAVAACGILFWNERGEKS